MDQVLRRITSLCSGVYLYCCSALICNSSNYLRQGVSVFVYLSVCPSDGLLNPLWTDFDDFFCEVSVVNGQID